jgi:hypothetical protein
VSPILAQNPYPDFRTLKGMEYLTQVVCVIAHLLLTMLSEAEFLDRMESLRLYPPVPMAIRKSQKDDYVDGVWVPKGTFFYIGVCQRQPYLFISYNIIGRFGL